MTIEQASKFSPGTELDWSVGKGIFDSLLKIRQGNSAVKSNRGFECTYSSHNKQQFALNLNMYSGLYQPRPANPPLWFEWTVIPELRVILDQADEPKPSIGVKYLPPETELDNSRVLTNSIAEAIVSRDPNSDQINAIHGAIFAIRFEDRGNAGNRITGLDYDKEGFSSIYFFVKEVFTVPLSIFETAPVAQGLHYRHADSPIPDSNYIYHKYPEQENTSDKVVCTRFVLYHPDDLDIFFSFKPFASQ